MAEKNGCYPPSAQELAPFPEENARDYGMKSKIYLVIAS